MAETITDYKTLLDVISFLPESERTSVVAISGFAGSGKTTLAQKLAKDLPGSVIVSSDDFLRGNYHARSDNWGCVDRQRMIDELLQPAKKGQIINYHAYDFKTKNAETLITVGKPNVLLLEGIGIIHPDLQPYFNFSIWIDATAEEAANHGMKRDKEILHTDNDAYWQQIWIPNDMAYFKKYYPHQLVDYHYKAAPRKL